MEVIFQVCFGSVFIGGFPFSPAKKALASFVIPPAKKAPASSVLPPLVGGNEGGREERGGWEKGLGDEGEKIASRAFGA